MTIITSDIIITPFKYVHAHTFAKLRREIDRESEHLVAKRGERKENAIHVIAKLLISQRRTVTLLAFYNKEAIGYVSLVFPKFKKLQGNAYLTIALREKYRGQGIGSMLMEQAELYAKEKGIRRIELEVFGKNTNAIALYKKRDYEIEGIKKDVVKDREGFDDVIIMTKRLS